MLIAVFFSGGLFAQKVEGTVSDANGTLPMVTVTIKGTSISTATDIDGKYTIASVSNGYTLVFSYVGYLTQEIPVTGDQTVNVVLKEDSQQLKEVIVTGYVGQQKTSISGAVSQVDMGDLSKTRVADVTQQLQGQVAGVFVAASTGAPGDGIQLRVRGVGTIGNTDVLYVVDGVPTRSIASLTSSDIKSMTVLKDAASASIYGSRAAGGVIVITTKRGSQGKGVLEVEGFTGVHFATNLPDMLNADQYLTAKDIAWHNTSGNAADAQSPYVRDRTTRTMSDTDWLDELFTTGISKNIQVSASGANDKFSYLVSGGLYDIDGIVITDNDSYKRANFRVNLNAKVSDRFTVGTNMQMTFIKQDKLSSSGDAPGVIRHAMIRPPVLSVYKDPSDPTWSADDPYTDLPFYVSPNSVNGYSRDYEYSSNPIAIVNYTDDKRSWYQAFGNVFAEYSFLSDNSLKFRSNLGIDLRFTHNKIFAQNYGDSTIDDPANVYYGNGRNNSPTSLNEDRGEDVTFTWSNTLNYVKKFGDHSLNALLGSEFIKNSASAIGGARSIYDNTTDPFRYLDYGGLGSPTTPYPYSSGSASGWSLLSWFGSATYGYKEKLFVTGTMRADASSRFGPNNKWGFFPAASANYILTNESFMKETSDWLSNLKLRASWGQNGNQEIPNYAYQNLYTITPNGPELQRLGNPDLKWETTTQTNLGIDFGFFRNKLNFSADYFIKKTDDILLQLDPPGYIGDYDPTYVNAGSVENKGFEFALNYQNNDHEFKYGVTGNLATLKNEVTKLHPNLPLIDDNFSHTRTTAGQPINSYYGYEFIGIYQNQAEINSYLSTDAGSVRPGDMKFRDVNGDGQITADDQTFIGNPIPKITYGLAFNASYKGFDVSFLWQGVSDVDRYNDLKQILNYDSRPFNSTTEVLGAWNGEGTSNTTPRLTFNDNGGSRVSSKMVEDASYLRLKNVEIGYTWTRIPRISNLRVYVSGQNLLTFTDYTGLDPESTLLKDQGTYPQMTSVLFGAKIKL
ncbi:SusC/RagA family TonB-linked outer membrane protein [Flavobacterium silvaticum]|uniref:SusC/RagA family TonB-linked outer membrane protein n=1 Tax=Flavobacterium silvaticum TaxID=1852020 RepID=UPI00293BACD8|nr:TonB-dependent receptor [Flavobacterium silvaticum]